MIKLILETINKEWEWLGISAVELIDENDFGNLIFRSDEGTYWRILPESPECIKIADNQNEFEKLRTDQDFQLDWQMETLVTAAKRKLGELEQGRKYGLKMPTILGGEYSEENLGTVSQIEQIGFSGDIARQIHDLPDGAKVKLKIE